MEENSSDQISKPQPGNETKCFPLHPSITSQRQVAKNLFVLCVGFVLLFTAFNGLSMLQSTMNQHQGIGVASQAIIYAGFCISALLFPKYAIKKMGCKRAVVLSMCCYIPYMAANIHFNWLTMIPSAIMVGLSASLLWSAQCTYFNESSSIYTILDLKKKRDSQNSVTAEGKCNLTKCDRSKLPVVDKKEDFEKFQTLNVKVLENNSSAVLCDYATNLNNASVNKPTSNNVNIHTKVCNVSLAVPNNKSSIEAANAAVNYIDIPDFREYSKMLTAVTARFFGYFGLMYRTSDIWSNLLSYYILQDNSVLDNSTEFGNCSCGAAFCNAESNCFEHNLAEPSQYMKNILSGTSILLSFIAVLLVFFFLDELETDKQPVKFSFSLTTATFNFIKRKEALFLLPISTYIGFQQGFYIGDFTKSYIACTWGVYHIGLVTICYGVAAGIFCTLSGFLVKHIGRIPVMLFAGFINAATCVFLLMWNPLPGQSAELFAAASMWGIAIGVLWSQLRAFYGVIFKDDEEAAFGGFYLWDSIGFCVAFSCSNYICTSIKIYILLAVSTIGIIGYLKTEMIQIQKMNRNLNKRLNAST